MDLPTAIARHLQKLHQKQVENAAARYETSMAVLAAATTALAPLQSPAQKRAGGALWRKLQSMLVSNVLGQGGAGGPPPPQTARAPVPLEPNARKGGPPPKRHQPGGSPPPKKHQPARPRPATSGASQAPNNNSATTPVGPGEPESDGTAKSPIRATRAGASGLPTPTPEPEDGRSTSPMEVDSEEKRLLPPPLSATTRVAGAATQNPPPGAKQSKPHEAARPDRSEVDVPHVKKLVEEALKAAKGCENVAKVDPQMRRVYLSEALAHRARARGMLLNAKRIPELRAQASAVLEDNLRAMKELGWKGDHDPPEGT
ncbi:hypothetical protein RB593_009203 [Gaeumannomyces tritici]